jgi:uracil-DNA glycosylase
VAFEDSYESEPWGELQRGIDTCPDCHRLGVGLFLSVDAPPIRPPEPRAVKLLFISEAPPITGGFWVRPPRPDDLRDQLLRILAQQGLQLRSSVSEGCLEDFCAQGLFLIQAVKWPLRESARNLRPTERGLIEHGVRAHLEGELQRIQPTTIVPLGRVACYASGQMFASHGFEFKCTTKLEEVRGRRFIVNAPCLRIPATLMPTGLPVRRRAGHLSLIGSEIAQVLGEAYG